MEVPSSAGQALVWTTGACQLRWVEVKRFGKNTPLGRAGQPKELAGIYVLLASDTGCYMTRGIYAVTGGAPLL